MTKQRFIYFLIVVIFSFSAIFFLSTPIILFIAKFSIFQQVNFFPGYAESFAIIPVLALIYLFVPTIIKITFKEWKYVVVAVSVMALTNTAIFMVNRYQANKFSQGLSNELDQAIQQSEQAQITITDFEEIPILDSSQNLENITFKIRFVSNITANMNISPYVGFGGKDIRGNDSTFGFDPINVTFDDKTVEFNFNSFYKIEKNKSHEISFSFGDWGKKIVGGARAMEYMATASGYFDKKISYSIHTNDAFGYGQGNATIINNNNILDRTGKSIKGEEEFAGYGKVLHFNSKEYRIRRE